MGLAWYARYPGDYLRDTMDLSLEQHGAYTVLLEVYYSQGSPITKLQAEQLAKRYVTTDSLAIPDILDRFFDFDGAVYRNDRAEREIAKRIAKQEKQSNAGKTTALKRWSQKHNGSLPNSLAKKKPDSLATYNHNHSHNHISDAPAVPDGSSSTDNSNHGTTNEVQSAPDESKPRATRLPKDWTLPVEWQDWALADQPTWTVLHCVRVADSFRDFWVSKSGANATKLDWEATWRNWVRKEGPMRAGQPGHSSTEEWPGQASGRADPRCSGTLENGERCSAPAVTWPGRSKKGYCRFCGDQLR